MTDTAPQRVIHITTGEMASGAVYDSQVVRPMGLLRQAGVDVTLLNYVSARTFLNADWHKRLRKRVAYIKERTGLPMIVLPSTPTPAKSFWSDARSLQAVLRLGYRDQDTILHCRGTEATHIALAAAQFIRNVGVMSEVRGFAAPEYLMQSGYDDLGQAPSHVAERFEQIDRRQRSAVAGAHANLYVSQAMETTLQRAWSLSPKISRIIPCCADVPAGRNASANRDHARRKLNLVDKFVVSFCGSTLPWQMVPETIMLFRRISAVNARAHFLVLTTDIPRFVAELGNAGVPNDQYTITKVTNEEVPDYLAAADLGILLRRKSLVNRVASPVKFAEYLACGVPVVLTDEIGDYSALVKERGTGCLIDLDGEQVPHSLGMLMDQIAVSPKAIRAKCLAVADELFDWGRYLSDYKEVHALLATSVNQHE